MPDKPTRGQQVAAAYADLGVAFGIGAGVITFFASWLYCVMAYDFVVGLGLGWFPSAICAAVIGCIVAFLRGIVLIVLLAGIAITVAVTANSDIWAYCLIGAACGWLTWRLSPRWLSDS